MKSKLNYLIGVSLGRKIKTKWFLIANIFLAVVMIGVINLDSVIKLFGGDFNQVQKIYILDKTDESFDYIKNELTIVDNEEDDSSLRFEVIKYDNSIEDAKKHISDNPNDWLVIIEHDELYTIKATLVSEGYIDIMDHQMIIKAVNSTKIALAIQSSEIPADKLINIYSPIELHREFSNPDKLSSEETMTAIMSSVFPIFILPFFMLVIFLVQMIGAEVNDEKVTRGMEIIISNVSPATHLTAKVVAGNLFVLLQGMIFLLIGGVGLFIRKLISPSGGNVLGFELGSTVKKMLDSGVGSQLAYIIPLALILMILTFISYSLISGILASMTTNIEDFQQIQTPIMIVLLIGYYLAMFAGMFEGAVFIKAVAYIPLVSAILSPSLLILGQIGVIEVGISIIISIVFNWLLIKYGLRVYKVGILNYSSEGLWKKMFKALKD